MAHNEKETGDYRQADDVHHEEFEKGPVVPEAIETTLIEAGGAPNPWGKGHVKLYMLCGLIYLCSTMNGKSQFKIDGAPSRKSNIRAGYDGSLIGSINVMPEYQNYYGLGPEGTAATGIVFSIFQIGQMTGALFTWIADWRGRKFVIIAGCCGVVIGAIFTALAPTLSSFIGARFLLSFCSTVTMTAAPLLLVEIAPPLYRGTVAGGFNTLYYMGSIIATFSKFCTPRRPNRC
jgi:hypothetical protein